MKPYHLLILSAAFLPLTAFAGDSVDLFAIDEKQENFVSESPNREALLDQESSLSEDPFFSLAESEPALPPDNASNELEFSKAQQPEAAPETQLVEEPVAVVPSEVKPEESLPIVMEIEIEDQIQESPVEENPVAFSDQQEESYDEIAQPLIETAKVSDKNVAVTEASKELAFNTLDVGTAPLKKTKAIQISFKEVLAGSPIIYTVLAAMSVFSFAIWLYNYVTLNRSTKINQDLVKIVREKLTSNQYDEAMGICLEGDTLLCKMLVAGISTRKHGLSLMSDTMKSEGKRASAAFWQRTALLNDVAIIAPMLGLLGTVLGMFYAFYDLNRSIESMSTLFDGLGVSVGTTVAGLIVAILAMVFQSTTKYRLVRALSLVENEAKSLTNLLGN